MSYRNPTPTVDVIIETQNGIVLIERANPPSGFALPGGFVDEGETVEQAAIREALEETGLAITLDEMLYIYSDPSRDMRQHTISTVFIARPLPDTNDTPKAGDDAANTFVVSIDELDQYSFAFDHRLILNDYLHFKRTGQRPHPMRSVLK